MKRFFVFILISFSVFNFSLAQKKEISQAQAIVKSGKELGKAEESMRKLLSDSSNSENMKIWHLLTEAIRIQYEQGNEQLYLKQKYDTAQLFNIEQRMFQAYEAMDSAEVRLASRDKRALKSRKRNSEYLDKFRNNLYSGGVFFISKQNYASAYSLFDTFLDCVSQPMFASYKYSMSSQLELSASYLATYCGAKLGDDSLALKYSGFALEYKPGREKVLQMLANIYDRQKRRDLYQGTLETGFNEYPRSEFFFSRLVDLLDSKNETDSALVIVDKAIASDSTNVLFRYAKSNLLLNLGRYEECVSVCDSLISVSDSLANAYYNAGIAYINMAFKAEKRGDKKSQIKKYYKSALPYMERYRELAPDQKDKWAAALYNVYLNLNMGKKFEEISNLLMQ